MLINQNYIRHELFIGNIIPSNTSSAQPGFNEWQEEPCELMEEGGVEGTRNHTRSCHQLSLDGKTRYSVENRFCQGTTWYVDTCTEDHYGEFHKENVMSVKWPIMYSILMV